MKLSKPQVTILNKYLNNLEWSIALDTGDYKKLLDLTSDYHIFLIRRLLKDEENIDLDPYIRDIFKKFDLVRMDSEFISDIDTEILKDEIYIDIFADITKSQLLDNLDETTQRNEAYYCYFNYSNLDKYDYLEDGSIGDIYKASIQLNITLAGHIDLQMLLLDHNGEIHAVINQEFREPDILRALNYIGIGVDTKAIKDLMQKWGDRIIKILKGN